MRQAGDMRLYEEEIDSIVQLQPVAPDSPRIPTYDCPHMIPPISKFQTGWLRLRNSDQVRQFAMCPECYAKLRDAGVAPLKGTWEGE